jgi:hypothetical protein
MKNTTNQYSGACELDSQILEQLTLFVESEHEQQLFSGILDCNALRNQLFQ